MAFRKIEARYVITTPMYLGGHASNVASERMREASFKGALRFWWRALMWNEAWQAAHEDEGAALGLLRQWEGQLFGVAAEKGKDSRASMFRLRCFVSGNEKNADKRDKLAGVGWQYLKGQGLNYRKAAFAPGDEITAVLLLHPRITTEQVDQLLKALVALGLFGGIGARSRRGVGSVAIQSLDVNGHAKGILPQKANELSEALNWLGVSKENLKCPLPPFAAFSKESRVDGVNLNISDFGCQFMNWRGYYESDCINAKSKPEEKGTPLFKEDHDNLLDATLGNHPKELPRRAVFGLPHNYFFKSVYDENKKYGYENRVARRMATSIVNYKSAFIRSSEKHERHASPFLIHFHERGALQCIIQTFLPNKFVEKELSIKGKRTWSMPFKPDWQVVHDFMNAIAGTRIL